jgi:predicted RND superfamily exporter protein
MTDFSRRLGDLRLALQAQPVSLATLPRDITRDWIAPDGRQKVTAYPKGDGRSNQVLREFVDAVRTVAPSPVGTPVSIQEAGDTVVNAFITAGALAFALITLLLRLALGRWLDVGLVLAPLGLAALLTVITSVVGGLPINFANIITLPLLLGIGVAFDIYFVVNWRGGITGPLQSSTARAILFSALTTVCAFGSLALSSHPGTADMGILLTISLLYALLCTLFVLPAMLAVATPYRRR